VAFGTVINLSFRKPQLKDNLPQSYSGLRNLARCVP